MSADSGRKAVFLTIKNVMTPIFFELRRCAIMKTMTCLATIRHLLSGLAMLGLILGPLAQPAMGVDLHPAKSVHSMQDDAHSAGPNADMVMPAGMPCCPDQAPTPDCGKNCPLMAMCMSQFFQDPASARPLVRTSLRSVIIPGSDSKLTGHLYGPPPKPPKTLV